MRIRPIRSSRASRAAAVSNTNRVENENKTSAIGEGISKAKNVNEEPITSGDSESSGDASFSPLSEVEISPQSKYHFKLSAVLKIAKTTRENPSSTQSSSTPTKPEQDQIIEVNINPHAELETLLANAQEDLRLMRVKLQELEANLQEKNSLTKGLFSTKNAKENAKFAKQKLTSHQAKMQPFIDSVAAHRETLLDAYKNDMTLTQAQIQQLTLQLLQKEEIEEKKRRRKNKLKELILRNKLTAAAIAKFKRALKK